MQSKIPPGFRSKARASLARILDHVLKEECFLLAKTQDYRGHVTGPNLYSLHRLFDEQRRQLDYWLERLIEQAKAIGSSKRGAAAQKPASSEAETTSGAGLPARTMIGDLLTRHERIARQLRDDLERLADPGTADLLLALVEFHETTAWMLRVVKNSSNATQGA